MGVYKNNDCEDQTSIETNARQSQNNFHREQSAREEGRPAWPQFPSDEEVIPWKFVPQQVVRKLVQKLNPELYLSGNNWRALAGELGLTMEEIRFLESVKGVHSEVFLNEYAARPDASLNEILKALKSINRKDCVELLCNSLPEIRHQVEASANTPSRLHTGDSMSSILSGQNRVVWHNGAAMLVPSVFPNGPSSLVAMPQPGPSGVYCMPGPASVPYSHDPGFHGNNRFSQPGNASYSPASAVNGNAAGARGMPGFNCSSDPGRAPYFSDSQRLFMLEQQQQLGHQQAVPPRESFGELGCVLGGNHSPLHSSFPGIRGNFNHINTGANIPCFESDKLASQSMLRQCSDDPHTNQSIGRQDRRPLHHSLSGPSSCQHCGGDSRACQGSSPSASHSSESSGLTRFPSQSPSSSADQTENHKTRFDSHSAGGRGRSDSPRKLLLSSPSSSAQEEQETEPMTYISPNSFHNSRYDRLETPSLSSGSSSGSSSSSGQTILTPNPSQSQGRPTACGQSDHPRIESPLYSSHNEERYADTSNAQYLSAGMGDRSDYTTSPREQGREHQSTKLSPLEKIEAMQDKYKPSSNYQTVVAEQKIDVERSRRTRPGKSSSKQSSASTTSEGSSAYFASQTYPMRVRPRQERDERVNQAGVASVEDLGSLTISKKSVSMPQDMKPQPYRKAWRGIKVFVTYSMDNPSHNNEVLCLGYFLKNNSFNCYLDTPITPSKSSEAWAEHMKKFHRKFYESDFVLVCISAKYLEDVSVCEPPANQKSPSDPHPRLHTLDIYQWMNQEYLNRQAFGDTGDQEMCGTRPGRPAATLTSQDVACSPQVVPVLFGGMTPAQIPRWMLDVGVPCKRWEADYADLAWLLTKPQTRIRPIREQTADTSSSF